MQRQFFKHLRVNSHLICSCVPWVKGLDQSWAMKIQIGSRNEADQCPVSSLYHHPTCIWPTFPGLETCLHSTLCCMCFCVGSIRKSFGSAMHHDCINTCSSFKHPGAADCGSEEENCLLYVSVFQRLLTTYPIGFSPKRTGGNPRVRDTWWLLVAFMWCERWWNFLWSDPGQWLATLPPGRLNIQRHFFTSYSATLLQFKI